MKYAIYYQEQKGWIHRREEHPSRELILTIIISGLEAAMQNKKYSIPRGDPGAEDWSVSVVVITLKEPILVVAWLRSVRFI